MRPSEAWLAWAEAQHGNLQIDLARLLSDYDMVRSAMGSEWIERQERRADLAHTDVSHFHPFYRDLCSCTNQGVVAVAELARYLTAFGSDSSLPAVLEDLRSDKFPSSLFELAMAYRWQLAGAQVALQPVTPKGVADFEAQIHGVRFIVECSVSPDGFFSEPQFRLPSLVAQAITSSVGEQVVMAAKLTVRRYPPGDFHGHLRSSVKRLCAEVLERIHSGADSRVSEDADAWLLEIERVSDTTERVDAHSGWDIAFRVSDRPRAPGAPLHTVLEEKRQREKARVFLKLPKDASDPNDRILKKLKKESRQLHGVSDPRIVMLDISGIAQDVLAFAVEDIQSRIVQLMRGIPELACVWLMSRGWSTALRFQYRVLFLPNPESTFQVPESFLETLGSQECRWDFITERDIPDVPEQDSYREWQRRSYPSSKDNVTGR